MMPATLHSSPRLAVVVRAQVRALASTLQWPALAALTLLVCATVPATVQRWSQSTPINFLPELSMVPGIIGLLFPLLVWSGVDRFGPAFFWTLPVDRRRHALARVGAGWIWLMALVAFLMLWLLAMTLVTGGSLVGPTVIRLLPSPVVPPPGSLDPELLRTVQRARTPVLWLVPFSAATGTYVLASALALGLRHPLRWLVGALLAFVVLDGVRAATHADWVSEAPQQLLTSIFYGPYGVDTLLTARSESLSSQVTLSTGETVGAWRGLPHLGQWAAATLMWIGAGLAALWAAVTRHRERR